eukprot:13650358-Alexandrium_andersonii.AAC.1
MAPQARPHAVMSISRSACTRAWGIVARQLEQIKFLTKLRLLRQPEEAIHVHLSIEGRQGDG